MTYALGTAKEAFDLILSIGAGTGLLYLLRWFWWRVSAWSEIAAMVSSLPRRARASSSRARTVLEIASDVSLLVTVGVTTVVWVVDDAPRAADRSRRRSRSSTRSCAPPGPGWRPIASATGVPASPRLAVAGAARLGARLHLRLRGAVRHRKPPLRTDAAVLDVARRVRRERRAAWRACCAASGRSSRRRVDDG